MILSEDLELKYSFTFDPVETEVRYLDPSVTSYCM